MGDTAYVLGDVDSQELDILEESNEESIEDGLIEDNFGGVISNMKAVQGIPNAIEPIATMTRSVDKEQDNDGIVTSPQKVNRTTNTQTGLPKATVANYAAEMCVCVLASSYGGVPVNNEIPIASDPP
jgi:hypothetical protein